MSDTSIRSRTSRTASRRDFLLGFAAAAVSPLLVGRGARADIQRADIVPDGDGLAAPLQALEPGARLVDNPDAIPQSARFGLGVAAGDVTTGGALLWARYDGRDPLRVLVWEIVDGQHQRVIEAPAVPADGGFVRAEVSGLVPRARYRYGFIEGAGPALSLRSPLGRFRTAPAADALEPLKFGAVSCTYNLFRPYTIEQAGARQDLDAFFHLGDATYNDGARTRADFRAKWAENLGTAGYRALRANTPQFSVWDDHETSNNWNPETIDPVVRDNARAVFLENQPVRPGPEGQFWRSQRYGLTAEVFALDCRSERRPSVKQYISRAQMDWLKAGLASSPAVFKIILNSVPITRWGGLLGLESGDSWVGYGAEREEILGFIEDERIPGVLWLAGDLHFGSAGRVSRSGVGARAVEVLAGPGAQVPNPLAWLVGGRQWDFVTTTNNYVAVALDPATVRARVTFHDGSNRVLAEHSYDLAV